MPNRILRDWTDSERIETISPGAEVFFTRLMMKADDYGCFTGNLKLLKAALYPLRDVKQGQLIDWITECKNSCIIEIYEAENKPFLFIYDFGQRMRTMIRKFPEFTTAKISTVSQLIAFCQQPADKRPPERKRKEEKGNRKEIEGENAKPTLEEFLKYCKEYLEKEGREYKPFEIVLKAKYNQWSEATWIDGNNKPILNWKTKIQNTIPYLKPSHTTNSLPIVPQKPIKSIISKDE